MKISTPLNKNDIKKLKAGDKVLLSGVIYTARDSAHKKLIELINNKEILPIPIQNQVIYYVGPSPTPPGKIIGSVGPTTSGRMDVFTPKLLDLGLSGMIGKGLRNKAVIDSIIKNQAIYFTCVGGVAALLASCVSQAKVIAFPELGPEAIFELTLRDFPVFVTIDAKGNNLYESRLNLL